MTVEDALGGFAPVGEQVPAVGHMYRFRSALAAADGIPLAAVAGDHLGSGIRLQPAGERLCLPIGQQLDEPMPFEVNERGAVAPAFTLGPVVHPENARGIRLRQRRPPDHRDERRRAGRKPNALCQPRSGLSAEGEGDRLEQHGESLGGARPRSYDPGQALGEDATFAGVRLAEEFADPQDELDGMTSPG